MSQLLRRLLLPSLLMCLWLLSGLPVAAQDIEPSAVTVSATAGFEGIYKEDEWLPVTAQLSNSGPSLEGEVRVVVGATSGDSVVYTAPISLPTQSDKEVTLYVHLPELYVNLAVQLLSHEGRIIASADTELLSRLSRDTLFHVVVSEEPVELGFLDSIVGSRSDAEVAFIDPAALPDAAAALNGVDVLIFTNVDTARLSSEQAAAIKTWTEAGGTLVVTGGLSGPQTMAGFSDLLPVVGGASLTVDDLPELQAAGGAPFLDPGPYLVTDSALRNGELLLLDGELPILARQDVGKGRVFFLALDPNVAPLLDWRGREAIWGPIAAAVPDAPAWAHGPQNSYSAANAVTRIPDVALPSILLFTCFLGVYVLAVGPINYLVLKRRKRSELAWFTIPGMILAFSALAYITSFVFAGRQITVAETSFVYGQAGADTGRVRSVLGLYSPQRARYDMTLPAETLVRPFDRDRGSMSGAGNLEAISRDSLVTLSDIQVDVSGINTFVADSQVALPDVTGQVELDFAPGGLVADVSIQNNSGLTLQNAGVLLGSSFIQLGDIAPAGIVRTSEPLAGAVMTSTYGLGYAPYGSGLSLNYAAILSSTNYYDDPDVYARWQMLESLNSSAGSTPASGAFGGATLLAWTEQPQLEVDVVGEEPERRAVTVYFLELPLSRRSSTTGNFVIPRELMQWQVLAESGIYGATISDFYMPVGWVEYEFAPWPEFQTMAVTDLQILLQSGDSAYSSSQPPELRLWDWAGEDWRLVEGAGWGETTIADFERFIGTQNEVRVRLDNTNTGVTISAIHPIFVTSVSQ